MSKLTRLGATLFGKRSAPANSNVGWADPSAIPPNSAVLRSVAGTTVNEHTALNLITVFRCVELIADYVAGLPLNSFANDVNGQKKQLPLVPALLVSPFGDVTNHQGMITSVTSLALLGNTFWHVLTRDNLGYATTLEILNPSAVRVFKKNGVKGYQFGQRYLDPDDVIHITRFTLPGGLRGLNPIEYMAQPLGIGLAADELAARMYSQGTMPSGVLTTEKEIDQEEATRLAERLMVQHGGLAQSHLPLVLDNGLKYEPLQIDPSTMQLLDTRLFTGTLIAQAFGVPLAMLQMEDRASFKDLESRLADFTISTLSGYLHRIEEAFSNALPRGQFVRFDVTELMRTTAIARAQRSVLLRTAGVATQNELRPYEDLSPILDDPMADSLNAPLNSNQNGDNTVSALTTTPPPTTDAGGDNS